MAINEDCLTLGVVALPATQGNAVRTEFVWDPTERVATGARWQKTEQNLLGQTVRQTRSGANGSTLETSMAYNGYGRTS